MRAVLHMYWNIDSALLGKVQKPLNEHFIFLHHNT